NANTVPSVEMGIIRGKESLVLMAVALVCAVVLASCTTTSNLSAVANSNIQAVNRIAQEEAATEASSPSESAESSESAETADAADAPTDSTGIVGAPAPQAEKEKE